MYSDIVVVNFSGTDVHRKLQEEFNNLYGNHFHNIESYTIDGIKKTDYYQKHLNLFKYHKYSGYFVWKPYIIQQTMWLYPDKLILYCDSNVRFKDFSRLHDFMFDRNYFFIEHRNFINKHWTKRDTFVYMNADREEIWNAHQIYTSLMGFRTTQETVLLLDLYRHYCGVEQIVTDSPNIYGKENLDGFREHRWEQSVMSILAKEYSFDGIWDYFVIPHFVDKIYPTELLEQKRRGL